MQKNLRCLCNAHEDEKKLLEDAQLNSSASFGAGYTYTKAQYVKDKEELKLAGTTVQVLYTPGHTIGGAVIICRRKR